MEKPVEKNNDYSITIEDMTDNGEGIGKVNGYTLFVKDTVIGDIIKVKVIKAKKTYGYGKLLEIIEPSSYRVEPICPIANKCGGCQIQALDYKEQLRFKENKIKSALERIGGIKDYTFYPILGMDNPYYYRNKSQFPVGKNKEGKIQIGFYAHRTHSIIETEKCYIGNEVNEIIIKKVKEFMIENNIEPYDEIEHKGIVKHILTRVGYHTKEIMICLVINSKKLPNQEKLIDALVDIPNMASICIKINKKKKNVILGKKVDCIWGKPYITDYIGEVKYQISPLSFYQVNPVQTEKLYNKVLEFANLQGDETVWDLYCGIGTISLFLAKKAKKVCGVEIVEEAIEDARINASINNIDNVDFFVGKAEEIFPRKYKQEGIQADVIVLDPPRKGCEKELLDAIVMMKPERIVYVSCDPATLARDLKYLVGEGYAVELVQGVDMFGHTGHVETVVVIERG